MKITVTLLAGLILAITRPNVKAEGITFEHTTWAEVLKKSQASKKPIFVDFYATWCGPCKMMTQSVFTQPAVGDYFNKNFISFKVDAEKEELALVRTVQLEAYPTLAFFDPFGSLMQKHVGAMNAQQLIDWGTGVVQLPAAKASVLAGTATREVTLQYVASARDMDPSTFSKLAPDLVKSFTIEDLQQELPWKIFTQYVQDLNTPYFQLAIQNARTLNRAHSDYPGFMNGVFDLYFNKMVKDGNLEGLTIYKKDMLAVYTDLTEKPYEYNYFDFWVNADYYLQRKQTDLYAKFLIQWVDTYLLKEPAQLIKTAQSLAATTQDKPNQDKALQWAQLAVSLDRNKESVFGLARVYESRGEKAKAISTATEVLQFKLEVQESEFINSYIEKLKS